MTKYTTAGLHTRVGNALRGFFCEDKDLLFRDVNERSITHKLAEHLKRRFPDLNVDCEYNRRGNNRDPKKLVVTPGPTQTDGLDAKTVYPDIIVHKRGCDVSNLLVIEVKKSNGRDVRYDKDKLRGFTGSQGKFRYGLGLFLVFDVDHGKMGHAECFKKGNNIDGCRDCDRLSEISDCGHQN